MIPNFPSSSPPNKSFYPNFRLRILLLFLIFSIPPYMMASRVYPMGGGTKRSIAIRDGPHSNTTTQMEGNARKKLRKLPHVFSKVLELPFRFDADVEIEEGPDFFQFLAKIEVDADVAVGNVRAHAVEIHPGVIKVVVRNDDNNIELSLDELDIDTWRYRLPSSTLPELATAEYTDGELVVTVPKGGSGSRREFVHGGDRSWGGGSRVVLVQ